MNYYLNKDMWIDILNEISCYVLSGEDADPVVNYKKGIIVADDPDGTILDFVKKELKYDELKSSHRVKELTIDESWSEYMLNKEHAFAKELWNRFVKETNSVRNGLLVLNISNIELFNHCWHIKQLVKQESELVAVCDDEIFDMENGFLNIPKMQEKTKFMKYDGMSEEEIMTYVDETLKEAASLKLKPSCVDFKGYVLLNIQGISWDEVKNFATEHDSGEFEALMTFCRRIKDIQ